MRICECMRGCSYVYMRVLEHRYIHMCPRCISGNTTLNHLERKYQYTRMQDRNIGMTLTAYPDVKVIVPSACFHLISFSFVSMCVFITCLYFGKAAFHGCPIKYFSLKLKSGGGYILA